MEPAAKAVRRREIRELRLKIAILSVQDEVTSVITQICTWLLDHGVPTEIAQELELVLAEALNNVVEHAYLYREDGEIEIAIKLTPEMMTAKIIDSGQKFDGPPPLREVDVESMSLEELPEGGFGWNLIRTLTDNVEFQRLDERNQLTLSRKLGSNLELM